jgi:D-alanyl-D-alanine carboxypeptidase
MMPNGQTVDARIYGPLMEMFEAAKEINLDVLPQVQSGYRSPGAQQEIYDGRVAEYMAQGWSEAGARAETEKWVALPGTSEHQLGIAADISGAVYAIYPWLQEHSWEYGFILRYPPDKTAITGISGEEWHYRYVGKEAAAEIHARGLTLEEYVAELQNAPAR